MEYLCYYEDAGEEESCYWKGSIRNVKKREDGFEAQVNGRGSSFHIIVGKYQNGNYLCIPAWQLGFELADYQDTFWNREQLQQVLGAVDSITIVNGIEQICKYIRNAVE